MKKSKLILASLLALALCLGGIVTPLAAGPGLDSNGALLGTETNPAQAAINKNLKLPVGTNTPPSTFEFEVKSVSVDGVTATPTNMPLIGTQVGSTATGVVAISFSGTETATPVGDVITLQKESTDIFAGKTFPHAGIYVYEITERENTNAAIDANPSHEDLTYSQAKYTLTVYVKDKTAPATGTYIYAIGDLKNNNDDGTSGGGVKVDPTPGGNGTNYTYSQMIFTNVYVKTNGPDDPDDPDPTDDSTLIVSKTVAGTYGSREIYFNFTVKVTAPSLVTTPPAYKAYIVEGSRIIGAAEMLASNKVTAAGADSNGNDYIAFTSGTEKTFSLRHNQRLVFINTPVGTSYNAAEDGTPAYKATLDITCNNTPDTGNTFGAANTLGVGVSVSGKLVGELLNQAAFTNTRDEVTPTGLNLNDIPFIGLIALALSAIAFYVVYKARKRKGYNN